MSSGGRDGYASDDNLDDEKSDLISSAESVDDRLGGKHYISSAPSSPEKLTRQRPDIEFTLLSVSDRVSSIESLAAGSKFQSSKITVKDELKPLIVVALKGKSQGNLSY